MNSDGHAQPWKCHGSVAITPVVEEKPTVPDDLHHCTSNADCSGLCTYCQNGAGKTPPFNCHAATNNCCLDDGKYFKRRRACIAYMESTVVIVIVLFMT